MLRADIYVSFGYVFPYFPFCWQPQRCPIAACITALTVIVKVVFLFLLALFFYFIAVEFQRLFTMCNSVFVDRFVQIIDIFLGFDLSLLFHKLVLVGIVTLQITKKIINDR